MASKLSKFALHNFDKTLSIAKLGLNTANTLNSVLPKPIVDSTFKVLNTISKNHIPLYYPAWPKGEKSIHSTKQAFTTLKKK